MKEGLKFQGKYNKKVSSIMDRAMKNLDLWKKLESRYRVLKRVNFTKSERKAYKRKLKLYKNEIQDSLNALILISTSMKKHI